MSTPSSDGHPTGSHPTGSVRAENGRGTVRLEDVYDATAPDLWSALTRPDRLARWIGDVSGDLSLGGRFHARFTSSWEGPGRVDVCEPARRLQVTMSPGSDEQTTIEAALTVEGRRTRLVIEERGLPLADVAGHGAGWHAHIDDLAAHLAGRDPGSWIDRWTELGPTYRELAAAMTPGFDEADRGALITALEYQRASVRSIVEGLSEEHWHTSVVPSGWTPAGVVAHLGDAERHWTCDVVLGHDPGHPFDEDTDDAGHDPDAPFVTDWPASKVLAYHRDQTDRTDAMLATTALGAAPRGRHGTGDPYQPKSVREIVLHLIEETAAHSGHLEIARELLDGQTGLGLR